jgi:microsomal dipeptidase-like Zn-dependent dipeptidase
LKLALAVLGLSLLLPSASQASAPSGAVELHAHLFMKEGMTWAFRGDFFGPLRATSWKDPFNSQANPESLENSGLSIVVAALYAHPLFTLSLRESVRRQIALARKFVLTHDNWVLATDPAQAHEALQQGKRVMILALEGASGIIETPQDIQEFIDDGGIRIVTPLHLMDDEFGGVAFLKGFRALASPVAWLKQLFLPHYNEGVRTNHAGLTPYGQWLITELLKHHVWIDLAHASDAAQTEMISVIKAAEQPLLVTHTVLRKFHGAERGISNSTLQAIKDTHGILGLMPSEEMLEGAPRPDNCPSSIASLATEYTEISAELGTDSVMLGSDFNGGIPHLAPTGPGCITGTSIDQQGLWNIGQSTEIWQAMAKLGAPVPNPLSKMADHFVEVWSKAYKNSLSIGN